VLGTVPAGQGVPAAAFPVVFCPALFGVLVVGVEGVVSVPVPCVVPLFSPVGAVAGAVTQGAPVRAGAVEVVDWAVPAGGGAAGEGAGASAVGGAGCVSSPAALVVIGVGGPIVLAGGVIVEGVVVEAGGAPVVVAGEVVVLTGGAVGVGVAVPVVVAGCVADGAVEGGGAGRVL